MNHRSYLSAIKLGLLMVALVAGTSGCYVYDDRHRDDREEWRHREEWHDHDRDDWDRR